MPLPTSPAHRTPDSRAQHAASHQVPEPGTGVEAQKRKSAAMTTRDTKRRLSGGPGPVTHTALPTQQATSSRLTGVTTRDAIGTPKQPSRLAESAHTGLSSHT